jgi:hypothetical protein
MVINTGWVHRVGEGFDVALDALPLNGRVVLRLNKAKPQPRKTKFLNLTPRNLWRCFLMAKARGLLGLRGPGCNCWRTALSPSSIT